MPGVATDLSLKVPADSSNVVLEISSEQFNGWVIDGLFLPGPTLHQAVPNLSELDLKVREGVASTHRQHRVQAVLRCAVEVSPLYYVMTSGAACASYHTLPRKRKRPCFHAIV